MRPRLGRPAGDLRCFGLSQAKERISSVLERIQGSVPKVATLLQGANDDPLAFYRLPAAHWRKLRSTNPLARLNKEIGRRSDVVGILPNDAAAIRLTGPLLIEQNDAGLVGRRYLSAESYPARTIVATTEAS